MNLSPEYLEQLKLLHDYDRLGFGNEPSPVLLKQLDLDKIKSVVDFGCGKGKMIKSLSLLYPSLEIKGYDPAVEEYSQVPPKSDLLYSTDVLEHFEPEHIDKGILNILNLADIQYHNIACHPAKKNLSDGRNCHLIVETPRWWLQKFLKLTGSEWSVTFFQELSAIRKEKVKLSCEIVLVKNV